LRILWVKAGKLLPVDSGGKIRSYNVLRHLARLHSVNFLSYYGGAPDTEYEAEIQQELPGSQTIHTAALDGSPFAQSVDYLRRAFQPAPFAVSKFTHPLVRKAVKEALDGGQFDVAICDFLSASLNFPDVLRTPCVLFQHNVEAVLWQRMASGETNPLRKFVYRIEARKMAEYEKRALGRFHHIVAVSDHDQHRMEAVAPGARITVVPTGVDTQKYSLVPSAGADPARIVFTGSMDWEPNIDAVIYFCQQIFPRVLAEFPSAVFEIVGRNPHARVGQLASGHVTVTGTVPSVIEYLRDATLVVVPLRIGGGTRLKIFEAMAMGKALISSSIGAEGLHVQHGRDLILADDPASFADAILGLLGDRTRRRELEQAAAATAANHDWSKIAERFAEALRQVHDSVAAQEDRPAIASVSS
jgi:glycosyltransferase involved in cell wall biosynthesis